MASLLNEYIKQTMRYKGYCKQCGKEIEAHYKSKMPTFCSYECSNRWKWDNLRKRKELLELTCSNCGKRFSVGSKDHRIKNGREPLYCCKKCADEGRKKKNEKVCPICGSTYRSSKSQTCSRECGYELAKLNSYKRKNSLTELTYSEYKEIIKNEELKEQLKRENSIKVICSDGKTRYYNQEKFSYSGREKEYMKEYNERNKEKRNKAHKNRLNNDEVYKFKVAVRKFICQSFKRRKQSKLMKTEEIIGCSFEELMNHICSLFQDGMTLENYGEWQIDHITPLSLANTKEEVVSLCHYTNLQPLWAKDNRLKSNKIIIYKPNETI